MTAIIIDRGQRTIVIALLAAIPAENTRPFGSVIQPVMHKDILILVRVVPDEVAG